MLISKQIVLATLSHENYLNQKRVRNSKYQAVFNFGQCRVCCDKATGIHYGVASCEGCKVNFNLQINLNYFFAKGFFKRSLSKYQFYFCKENKNCTMYPKKRKKCKYCRWKLCINSGMSLLDVRIGRIPNRLKEIKLKKDVPVKEHSSIRLWLEYFLSKTELHRFKLNTEKILPDFHQFTSENQLIIFSLLRDKVFQAFKEQISENNGILNNQIVNVENIGIKKLKKKYLSHLTNHAQNLFKIVEELPGFQNITKDDLKIVISEGFFSTLVIKTIKLFRNENLFYMLDEKTVLNSYLFELVTSKLVKDLYFEFYTGLSGLKLTDQEYALMIPIFLSKFSKAS